jgi:hypothetical protein
MLNYNAQIHLAYMLICRGDLTGGCLRLKAAYKIQNFQEASGEWARIPKAEFPEHIVRGIQKVDGSNRPAWPDKPRRSPRMLHGDRTQQQCGEISPLI